MMELIRSWLIGVTVSALIAALADGLIPDGTVKKVGKLIGGLLILFAVLQPLGTLDYEDISEILVDYRIRSEEYSTVLETENIQLIKTIIEDETAAYIQDKAGELGITCEAKVTCKVNENKTPYPASVAIYGDLSENQIEALSKIIEGDLAVAAESQYYERAKQS